MKRAWLAMKRFFCPHSSVESTHDYFTLNGVFYHHCKERHCRLCWAQLDPVCPPDKFFVEHDALRKAAKRSGVRA